MPGLLSFLAGAPKKKVAKKKALPTALEAAARKWPLRVSFYGSRAAGRLQVHKPCTVMSVRTDVVNLNVNVNGDKGKKELNDLRRQAADLTAEMRNLKKGSEEWIKANKELTQINARMDSLKEQIGLTALSQRELNKELQRLNQIKSILTPGTEEFKKLQKEIDAVGARLKEVRTGKSGFQAMFAGIKDEVKQFGVLAASYLGFEFLTSQVKNVIGAQKKLSDENRNIAKTTGLTADEIERLNKDFKELDTRSSNSKLRQFAEEAGKLGKEGVANVERFVDEANKIDVALGEDLGEGAIEKIAKISGIFGQSMTQIASGINSVGQASAASESYQVDFAFRTAGTAKAARLAAGDVLGYAAALEVNGQTAEVAATSLNNFFLDFVSKSNQFGKAAGFAKGELAKLINQKGVNEAFLQFLTRLKETSTSTEDFVNKMSALGIDGARGANVLLVLANNIDEVRKQQLLANTEISKGTSVLNEYNIKNNGFAATIDKLSKLVNSAITSNRFVSFVTGIVDGLDTLLRSLPAVFDWIGRNALAFKLWGAALLVNSGLLPKIIGWIGSMLTGLKGLTAAQIAQTIATKADIIATTTLSMVKALLAGNLVKVRQEWQLLNAAIGRNPLGIFLIAAGAVAVAVEAWSRKTKELSEREKEHLQITKEIAQTAGREISQLELLKKTTQDLTLSIDERTKAAKKLQELWPSIFGNLTTEQILAGKVADAYERAAKAIVAKAKSQTFENKLADVTGKRDEQLDIVRAGLNSGQDVPFGPDGSINIGDLSAQSFGALPKKLFDAANAFNKLNAQVNDYTNKIIAAQKETQQLTGAGPADNPLAEGAETLAEAKKRQAEEKKQAAAERRLAKAEERRQKKAEQQMESSAKKLDRLQQQLIKTQEDLDAAYISEDEKKIQAVVDKYRKIAQEIDRELHDKKGNLLVSMSEYAALIAGFGQAEVDEFNLMLRKSREEREKKQLESMQDSIDKLHEDTSTANKDRVDRAQGNVVRAKPGSLNELDAHKALLRAKFIQDTEYLDKSSEAYKTAQAELNKNLRAADKEYLQKKIAEVGQVLQEVGNLFSAYVDLQNQKDDAVLEKERQDNNTKKADYQRQLAAKLISQKQFDTAIASLDAQLDQRQKEITARQAKRAKAAALFTAIINTAMGVARAFADYQYPYSLIVGALVAAAGAVQISAIESRDVPKGRKGLIVSGPSHENGGIDMINHNTGERIANIEGGEPVMVLSKNTYANNKPIIDRLIYNSQHRNGAAVAASSWYGASGPQINTGRVIPLMRNGGTVTSTGNSSADTGTTNALLQQLVDKQDQTIQAVTAQNKNLRAYIVRQDLTDYDALVDKAKSVAGVNQKAA